jgi:hypothetical protein
LRASRVAILLWVALIVILLIVEFAEITHVFTLPVTSALSDPLSLLIALVFTTVLAMVGAIFIGIYVSHRLLSPTGFTPFEEEMLRMRSDLSEIKRDVGSLRGRVPAEAGESDPSPSEERP